MAADAHHVFVRTDSGQVERIDPAANAVDGELDLHSGCQGIGEAAGSVWACDDDGIVRIDPSSLQVETRIAVTKAFEQGHLVDAAGRLWVLTYDGSRLVGIDTTSNTPGDPITLPIRGTDLAAADDLLWVVSKADDAVVLFDPNRATVVQRLDGLGHPGTIAADESGAWVSGRGWTAHIDGSTGTIDRRSDSIGDGTASSIAVGGDSVWIPSTARFLDRLDPATATSLRQWPGSITTGAESLYAFGSVWIAAYDDGTVWRIAP